MKKNDYCKYFTVNGKKYSYYDITLLQKNNLANIARLPFSIRILVENLLRKLDDRVVKEKDLLAISGWQQQYDSPVEIPYHPARVLMQDFTGVPAVVDLASMRDAVQNLGGDPSTINPLVPVELVVDHSIQLDYSGTSKSLQQNVEMEYSRNKERYALLKWAQKSFDNFNVVPPNSGISDEDLPHIFDRFFRVKGKATRHITGSGLGLSLVKEVVEAHHGYIDVHSTPDKGTTFTLSFPLAEPVANS